MKRKHTKRIGMMPQSTSSWFIFISILGVVLTLISLFVSHGSNFSRIFFKDTIDVGMDFFHSIEYTKARSPYVLYGTLYPPLANLLFYCLLRFVPEWQLEDWAHTFSDSVALRTTENDLRVWQSTMFLFIVFLIVSAVLLILMVQKHFTGMKEGRKNLIGICALLSYGVLYGYERGNILILSMICTMFFVYYKDSKNPLMSELALIMLAIGAGLKIYPAVFGAMLIYDKQYAKATRAIIYGVLFFVLPMFIFHDPWLGFEIFFEKIFKRSTVSSFSVDGYGFDNVVNTLVVLISGLIGREVNEALWLRIVPQWNIIVLVGLLITGFFMKKRWQKTLCCALAMMLYSDQGIYATMFFLIPLMNLLQEETVITKKNFVPFSALTLSVVLLPIMDAEGAIISYEYGRYQFCMLLFLGYILVHTAKQMISRYRK
ncbi:MAG: DUF2029 domain-containing protein [Lachnospiraceae bacterium]|nr:DUF2029 domain-containing protein [Lachnospiraceae bacterium]